MHRLVSVVLLLVVSVLWAPNSNAGACGCPAQDPEGWKFLWETCNDVGCENATTEYYCVDGMHTGITPCWIFPNFQCAPGPVPFGCYAYYGSCGDVTCSGRCHYETMHGIEALPCSSTY